jgi:hypothetical protein
LVIGFRFCWELYEYEYVWLRERTHYSLPLILNTQLGIRSHFWIWSPSKRLIQKRNREKRKKERKVQSFKVSKVLVFNHHCHFTKYSPPFNYYTSATLSLSLSPLKVYILLSLSLMFFLFSFFCFDSHLWQKI